MYICTRELNVTNGKSTFRIGPETVSGAVLVTVPVDMFKIGWNDQTLNIPGLMSSITED